ncbi:MAG TPA: polyprenyl synthetase family protein [Anaerolineales bacterium]|nr:polyprenyl synthetase family protein [Anaerolineales bacterium]
MNLYEGTLNYISNLPVLKEWPETKSLLERAACKQPRDWRLPLLACEAVGGTTEQGICASASIASALLGILLIDDMLDDDPRGEFQSIGQAQAANFASVFLTASSQAILQSGAGSAIKLQALESLNQMITSVAFGQYLDVQNPADEGAYWRVVKMKSAPFFKTALEIGTLFGGAPIEVVRDIGEIGRIYGEMIQIHDDMNDCMATPAGPDWIQGRSPLPILFAQTVDHKDRGRFLELRQRIPEVEALREAQEILIKCGAISYSIDCLLCRYREARSVSSSMKLVHPEKMNAILEELIVPVWRLFEMAEKLSPQVVTDA